jgi:radical SAM superfamily enzyme YgiQ (UPF0313 family)
MPDYGISIIGSILAEKGYAVDTFIEHVQPPSWDALTSSDLVLMSTMSAAASRIYNLSDKIRSELKIPVIMGGTHATYFTESCLDHCDVIVLREGDDTIVELIEAISSGFALSGVAGIAYKEKGEVIRTKNRPGPEKFDTIQNYALIRGFKKHSWLEILRRTRVPLLTIQSSRGCPFHCSFCIVDTMFDKFRLRGIESIIEDLRDKRRYGRELLFIDNYFGANIPFTKKLLNRIIAEDFGFDTMVLCRIDIARDDEILGLMRKAGITALYLGIESVQPETLINYAKKQTVATIESSIRKLHAFGFRISGSFVMGADTDRFETIDATVQFALKNHIEVCYFFPLWGHYIEEKLGNKSIIPWHRSIFKGWEYCDGNFVSHFPKHMRPSELQQALIDAHRKIYSPEAFRDSFQRRDWTAVKEKAVNLYGWRFIEKGLREYIPWLREIEYGFYDENSRLIEHRLKQFVETHPEWTFPESRSCRRERKLAGEQASPLEDPAPCVNNIRCRVATD